MDYTTVAESYTLPWGLRGGRSDNRKDRVGNRLIGRGCSGQRLNMHFASVLHECLLIGVARSCLPGTVTKNVRTRAWFETVRILVKRSRFCRLRASVVRS